MLRVRKSQPCRSSGSRCRSRQRRSRTISRVSVRLGRQVDGVISLDRVEGGDDDAGGATRCPRLRSAMSAYGSPVCTFVVSQYMSSKRGSGSDTSVSDRIGLAYSISARRRTRWRPQRVGTLRRRTCAPWCRAARRSYAAGPTHTDDGLPAHPGLEMTITRRERTPTRRRGWSRKWHEGDAAAASIARCSQTLLPEACTGGASKPGSRWCGLGLDATRMNRGGMSAIPPDRGTSVVHVVDDDQLPGTDRWGWAFACRPGARPLFRLGQRKSARGAQRPIGCSPPAPRRRG